VNSGAESGLTGVTAEDLDKYLNTLQLGQTPSTTQSNGGRQNSKGRYRHF